MTIKALFPLACISFLLASSAARAVEAVWSATPTSGSWNAAANWMPQTVPNGADDTATFATSSKKAISLSNQITVKQITFSTDADAFTITVNAKATLDVTGGGVANQSGNTQTFEVSSGAPFGTAPGVLTFTDGIVAKCVINTRGGDSTSAIGAETIFSGNSSAGASTILVTGGQAVSAQSAVLGFNGTATAGSSAITLTGSAINSGSGAHGSFSGHASAGSATITITAGDQEGDFPADLLIAENSTLASSTIIAKGAPGRSAGGLSAYDSSKGGTARIELLEGGYLYLPQRTVPIFSVGSIEGDGNVGLSANTLTVGSNNLNTTFDGVIDDGGDNGSLTKIGTGTFTLTGANTYLGPTTVNAGKLVVDGSISSDVTVGPGGALGGGGSVGNVVVDGGGVVSPGDPKTLSVKGDYDQAQDSTLALTIAGTAAEEHDQLAVTGQVTISPGAILELDFAEGFAPKTGDTFTLITSASINGSYDVQIVGLAAGFQYTIAANGNGNLILTAKNNGVATTTAAKLLNISSRLEVGTGDNVLIAGFIVTGSAPKKVYLRALGPSLSDAGLNGLLADPVLELHEADGTVITNDNWMDTQKAAILATGFPPPDDLESAIIATLDPGAYTAVVRGQGASTGLGLVEAYDLDQTASSEFANISTRADVGTGSDVLIGGFILGGGTAETSDIVVRGLGPSLAAKGLTDPLLDPTLELHNGNGDIVATNDDWMDDPNSQSVSDDGLAPDDPKESALAVTLAPDSYTAIVRGKDGGIGVGLVEIYRLP